MRTLAILNAPKYRDEQRAGENLEALTHSAHVGVMVYDTNTQTPLSLSREFRRIVSKLQGPDGSAERILDEASVHLSRWKRQLVRTIHGGSGARERSKGERPIDRRFGTTEAGSNHFSRLADGPSANCGQAPFVIVSSCG